MESIEPAGPVFTEIGKMSTSQKSDGEPHDHHFVPRGFLRQWCGPDNQLAHIFRKDGEIRCRRIGPKGVASRRDLYNLRDIGISRAVFLTLFTLEQKFGARLDEYNFEKTLMQEIDDRGIAAHRKFLEKGTAALDPDTLHDLLRFIFILGARNPGYLETLQDQVIGHLEKLLSERGLEGSPLFNADDLRRDLNAAKITVIEAILNEAEFKRRYDGMAGVPYVLDTDKLAFVTTDFPFVATPGEKAPVHFVPLSPRHCLIMSKNFDFINNVRHQVNEHLVEYVNALMIAKANNVYAKDFREKETAERLLGILTRDPAAANKVLFEKLSKTGLPARWMP